MMADEEPTTADAAAAEEALPVDLDERRPGTLRLGSELVECLGNIRARGRECGEGGVRCRDDIVHVKAATAIGTTCARYLILRLAPLALDPIHASPRRVNTPQE